jgi:hypothetical protein
MLKSCPSNDELRRFVDEQLSVERTRQVNEHLQACGRCGRDVEGLHTLLAAIAAPSGAVTPNDEHFKRAVLSALDDERPSWKRRWQWPVAVAAAAMAAAMAIVVIAPTTAVDDQRFMARGEADSSLASLAGVDALLSRRSLRQGERLGPGQRLAFRVRNIGDQPLYLLAFALDAASEVHWFYPAYTDASKDPPATRIAPGTRELVLPDQVEPEGCADGPLEVLAVISREPRTVKQVERSLANRRGDRIAKIFTGDLLRSWSVRWQSNNRAEP